MKAEDLPQQDRDTLKRILIGYREEGAEPPLLPLDVDLDGDGIADAWGLDENDEVVLVSGVNLDDTVYVSDGDNIKFADLSGHEVKVD